MIAFVMIVRDVVRHGQPKVPLAEWNNAIETFLFDGPDEALGVGIRIRRPPRRLHNPNAAIAQQPSYLSAPFRVGSQISTRCARREARSMTNTV